MPVYSSTNRDPGGFTDYVLAGITTNGKVIYTLEYSYNALLLPKTTVRLGIYLFENGTFHTISITNIAPAVGFPLPEFDTTEAQRRGIIVFNGKQLILIYTNENGIVLDYRTESGSLMLSQSFATLYHTATLNQKDYIFITTSNGIHIYNQDMVLIRSITSAEITGGILYNLSFSGIYYCICTPSVIVPPYTANSRWLGIYDFLTNTINGMIYLGELATRTNMSMSKEASHNNLLVYSSYLAKFNI